MLALPISAADVVAAIDRNTSALKNIHLTLQGLDMHLTEQLAALKDQVTKTAGVVDSAVALLNGLADALRDHAGDAPAIQEAIDIIKSKTAELAAAVAADAPPTE